jgi:hypothetical protein
MTRHPTGAAALARLNQRATAVMLAVLGVAALVLPGAGSAFAKPFSPWGAPVNVASIPGTDDALNTEHLEGCPFQSPDGLSLYMASNRPGGMGGLDIWVAERTSTDAPWGAPENLGAPVNSAADDFCPTPVRGKGLFFVSTRAGGCGGADLYFARRNPAHGWGEAQHLACAADGGPNTAGPEFSPSYVEAGGRELLYFSSGTDIVVSERVRGGAFGPGTPVVELNSASNDLRPNVRKDGLEIVFDSDRPGGFGGPDIWSATRASVHDAWSAPVNLGPTVNSEHVEARPSLSWDGATLYFGSNRPGGEGSSDLYVSTRLKVLGSNR